MSPRARSAPAFICEARPRGAHEHEIAVATGFLDRRIGAAAIDDDDLDATLPQRRERAKRRVDARAFVEHGHDDRETRRLAGASARPSTLDMSVVEPGRKRRHRLASLRWTTLGVAIVRNELEPVQIAHAIEEPLAGAEKRRHEIDDHLVDEAGSEILLRGFRATAERDILARLRRAWRDRALARCPR